MTRTIAIACLASFFCTASVHAADPFMTTPFHLRPLQQDRAHDWGGGYVGGHIGYGWGKSTNEWWNAVFPVTPDGDIHYQGVTGGIHAGYQVQHGNLVIGAEADISLGDWRGDDSQFAGAVNTIEIGGISTLRGRLGWAQDNVLVFATGGLAAASFTKTDALTGPMTAQLATGWAIGAGAELALSDNLRARAEILHVRLNPVETALLQGAGAYSHRAVDPTLNIARLALSYGF